MKVRFMKRAQRQLLKALEWMDEHEVGTQELGR